MGCAHRIGLSGAQSAALVLPKKADIYHSYLVQVVAASRGCTENSKPVVVHILVKQFNDFSAAKKELLNIFQ